MPKNRELLPPEGDKKLGYRVFEILAEVLQDKQDLSLPQKWSHFYELGKNKHWKTATKKGVSLVSANLLHKHRQRTINMITGNNPTFELSRLTGAVEEDNERYDALLKCIEYWWRETEQQDVFDSSVGEGETYGCCVEKGFFNPEAECGIGEVEIETIDPFYFGFYPVNCRHVEKAEAHLHYWPMSVREACRRWPDKADEIVGDIELLEDLGDTRREIKGGQSGAKDVGGYISTLGGIAQKILNFSGDGKAKADELIICEMWVKDFSTVSKKVSENSVETTPRYTGGIRKVTVCNGGSIVLSDQNNPSINPNLTEEQAQLCYLYSRFPFTLTPSVKDTYSPWGICDFEQLEGLQKEINKAISQYTSLKDKAARGKLINPATSGVRNEEFTNYASIINPSTADAGLGIRYMPGPQDYGDILNAVTMYKDLFFSVSGTFDLEQAQTPGRDVIAYKAIAALLEQAQIMSKNKVANYSKMIRDRGRMYISLAQNWYTEERWVSFEEDGENKSLPIKNETILLPTRLSVISGSTMPISKVQKREEALALYERQAIDRVELLKRLEWPDRKKVNERMSAGPVGEMMQKLEVAGVSPELLEYFQAIFSLELKDLQDGDLPPAMEVLAQAFQQGQDQQPPPSPEEMKEQAETAKINAEAELTQEKVITERIDQQVKAEGVGFDLEKLEIEKAKADAEIESKLVGTYNEKGIKSNNANL